MTRTPLKGTNSHQRWQTNSTLSPLYFLSPPIRYRHLRTNTDIYGHDFTCPFLCNKGMRLTCAPTARFHTRTHVLVFGVIVVARVRSPMSALPVSALVSPYTRGEPRIAVLALLDPTPD